MTADLDAIHARHVPHLTMPGDPDKVGICVDDEQDWPCDTAIVLAALDECGEVSRLHADEARQLAAARDSTGQAWLDAQEQTKAAIERETRLRAAIEQAVQELIQDVEPDAVVVLLNDALATTPEYVPVRKDTGGVMEDGTTNHPPIDFDQPPVATTPEGE